MPLPIMHSFAGYAVYRVGKEKNTPFNWMTAGVSMLLANLADFDFAAGILYGNTTQFHRGISHTLGGALICAALVTAAFWFFKKAASPRVFLVSLASYYSHVILDYLGGTSRPMQLFWPVLPNYYGSDLNLFLPLNIYFPADGGFLGFFGALFSQAFFARIILETLLVVLMIGLSRSFIKLKESRLTHVPSLASFTLIFLFLTFLGLHALRMI